MGENVRGRQLRLARSSSPEGRCWASFPQKPYCDNTSLGEHWFPPGGGPIFSRPAPGGSGGRGGRAAWGPGRGRDPAVPGTWTHLRIAQVAKKLTAQSSKLFVTFGLPWPLVRSLMPQRSPNAKHETTLRSVLSRDVACHSQEASQTLLQHGPEPEHCVDAPHC